MPRHESPASRRQGTETRRKQSLLTLRCDEQQRQAWEREAHLEGMPLSLWVRRVLDQRAADSERERKGRR
jgi:predicted HicB family RNase H-like nuclease